MARLKRLILAGQPHLVAQHVLDGRTAFVDEVDRAGFVAVLREGLANERMPLHAYVLRRDGFRLLVTPAAPEALGRLLQAVGRRYVVACNRRHGYRGTLWDGRFRACPVESGEPLLAAMAWIELGGATDDASSAAHHLGVHRDPLITDPPAYWDLGNTPFEREAVWRARLEQGLPAGLEQRLHGALRGGWAVGSPPFVAAAGATGRPAAPRAPGRPRRRQAAS